MHRGEGDRFGGRAGLVRLGDARERGRRGLVLECGLLGVTVRQGDREFGLSGLVRIRYKRRESGKSWGSETVEVWRNMVMGSGVRTVRLGVPGEENRLTDGQLRL